MRVVQGNVRRLRTRKRSAHREMSLQALEGGESSAGGPPADARGGSPGQVVRREERFERLKEALRHATPDYRKVVFQVCLQNMAIKDVAAAMGRSLGAVSMLLFRALRQIKESFGMTESLSLPGHSLEDAVGDDEDSDDAGT